MNLDDETLLSAYLDDELDTAERMAVEWSVESSPSLADQLRALATARDAVASLGRPANPGDLAPSIVGRLAADRRRARLRALARPGRVAVAVAGLSSMAASLLFALFLLHRATHENPDLTALAPRIPADRTHSLLFPEPPKVAENVPVPSTLHPTPSTVAVRPSVVVAAEEAREREDRLRISRMLEQPEVRLVLITTDVIDAADRVQHLIDQDPRKTPDFGRITLRAGIVVDPGRPGSAEVFVVPVAEGGRRSFLDKLRAEFREVKEEGEPGEDLVTQLTEVGHAAVFRGKHASPLIEPPADVRPIVAKRGGEPGRNEFHFPEAVDLDRLPLAGLPPIARAAGLEAGDSASGPPRRPVPAIPGESRPLVGPIPLPRPDEMVTVLIWVTRPPKL
jgi:hypothetical protein